MRNPPGRAHRQPVLAHEEGNFRIHVGIGKKHDLPALFGGVEIRDQKIDLAGGRGGDNGGVLDGLKGDTGVQKKREPLRKLDVKSRKPPVGIVIHRLIAAVRADGQRRRRAVRLRQIGHLQVFPQNPPLIHRLVGSVLPVLSDKGVDLLHQFLTPRLGADDDLFVADFIVQERQIGILNGHVFERVPVKGESVEFSVLHAQIPVGQRCIIFDFTAGEVFFDHRHGGRSLSHADGVRGGVHLVRRVKNGFGGVAPGAAGKRAQDQQNPDRQPSFAFSSAFAPHPHLPSAAFVLTSEKPRHYDKSEISLQRDNRLEMPILKKRERRLRRETTKRANPV